MNAEPEIAAVLEAGGVEAVATSEIGGWRAGRVTYRVEAADGEVYKVRRAQGRRRVVAVADALLRALADPQVPPPLAVVDAVALERWVDGETLAARCTTAHRAAAGDLLGRMHTTSVPGVRFHRTQVTDRLRDSFDRQVDELVGAGHLTGDAHGWLTSAVHDALPPRAPRGLTHGDFAPENLVVTPAGELVAVDNEAVRIDFLDVDLARAWARWAASDDEWAVLLDAYQRRRSDLPAADETRAWRAVTLVRGYHRWRRAHQVVSDAPEVALRRFVEDRS